VGPITPTSAPKGGKYTDLEPAVAEVERRYFESWQLRRELMAEWFLNVAFFRGHQHVFWDNRTESLDIELMPSWKIQATDNYILPSILTMAGLIVDSKPPYTTRPNDGSSRAENAARAGAAYLESNWRDLHLYRKVLVARLWALLCGRGFLGVWWDPDSGDQVEVLDVERLTSTGGRDFNEGPDVHELPMRTTNAGSVKVDVISPLRIHVDPLAQTLYESPWVLYTPQVHLGDLRRAYGSVADKVGPGAEYIAREYERRLLYTLGQPYPAADVQDIVTLKEFWRAPCEEHPNGRLIVTAGGVLLKDEDHPYGGEHPFVEFGGWPSLGGYWDEAPVTHLRPHQLSLNNAMARHKEAGLLMANSKWFAWEGSGLLDSSLDTEPGEVIEIDTSVPSMPQRSDPPPVGQHWLQVRETEIAAMDNVTGLNDASWGRSTEHDSGRALAIAQEGTMTRMSLLLTDQERGMQRLGDLQISRAQQFFDEDRLVRSLGEDNEPLVYAFSDQDASLCSEVIVAGRQGMPYSRIARMEFVLELWDKNGIVNADGQRDPRKLLRLLEFGDVDSLFAQTDAEDRQHAERENQLFLAGKSAEVEVAPFDDHYVHADTVRRLLVASDGRRLKEEDPASWQAAVQHRDLHIQMIAAAEAPALGDPMEMARPPVGGGEQGQGTPPGSLPPGQPGAAPDLRVVAGSPMDEQSPDNVQSPLIAQ